MDLFITCVVFSQERMILFSKLSLYIKRNTYKLKYQQITEICFLPSTAPRRVQESTAFAFVIYS